MSETCKHCAADIEPCTAQEASCLGWVHRVGGHVCRAGGLFARAEPHREDTTPQAREDG